GREKRTQGQLPQRCCGRSCEPAFPSTLASRDARAHGLLRLGCCARSSKTGFTPPRQKARIGSPCLPLKPAGNGQASSHFAAEDTIHESVSKTGAPGSAAWPECVKRLPKTPPHLREPAHDNLA